MTSLNDTRPMTTTNAGWTAFLKKTNRYSDNKKRKIQKIEFISAILHVFWNISSSSLTMYFIMRSQAYSRAISATRPSTVSSNLKSHKSPSKYLCSFSASTVASSSAQTKDTWSAWPKLWPRPRWSNKSTKEEFCLLNYVSSFLESHRWWPG